MFVDRAKIHIAGGKGGDGCVSFRREKYVPHGGPNGGDGGNGGSVIIEAVAGVDSLAILSHKHHWNAHHGEQGRGDNCHGKSAEDLIIQVPPGTVVFDEKGKFQLKDLANPGDRVTAAKGGKGGKGNTRFKSSTNRVPRQFTPGEPSEERTLILELKVIADVGLIGKPNAGKSTLLSRLSRARPEIADYPFTTKFPNLGRVQIDFDHAFIMADIPGLIEGAHAGVGLGHEFLRHVERTRVLVHLVEPQPMDETDPVENYLAVRNELNQYDVALADRPEVVVVSKGELPEAEQTAKRLEAEIGKPVLKLSAVTGEGLDKLLHAVSEQLSQSATS